MTAATAPSWLRAFVVTWLAIGTGCATAPRDGAPLMPQRLPLADTGYELLVYGDLAAGPPPRHRLAGLEEFLYGPDDRPRPRLRNPQGMCVRGQELLVCDQGLPDVVALDLDTGRLRRWTHRDDRPACPVDVAAAADGTVLVADTTRHAVLHYDARGRLKSELTPPDEERSAFRPAGLCVVADMLYIADAAAGKVRRLDLASGVWLRPLESTPEEPLFGAPTGVASANDQTLLVADALLSCVVHLDADGKLAGALGTRGRQRGQFVRPMQVCTTRAGFAFATDAARQSVLVFSPDGDCVAELPADDARSTLRFTLPHGVERLEGVESAGLLARMGYTGSPLPEEVIVVSDTLGACSLRAIGLVRTQTPDAEP